MPSSEEESQWLVGSGGGGLAPSGGNATKTGGAERVLSSTRTGLYTEEMATQPANVTTAGVNSTSADSAEHDLIDSTADATLLAQFHEDAIKQVILHDRAGIRPVSLPGLGTIEIESGVVSSSAGTKIVTSLRLGTIDSSLTDGGYQYPYPDPRRVLLFTQLSIGCREILISQ